MRCERDPAFRVFRVTSIPLAHRAVVETNADHPRDIALIVGCDNVTIRENITRVNDRSFPGNRGSRTLDSTAKPLAQCNNTVG